MRRYQAFSLLEIMMAIALGSFITLGLADIYFSHQRSYQNQKALMQATQNGLLASNTIETLLSQDGYAGCLSLDNLQVTNHISESQNDLAPTSLPGSSVLQLNFMSPDINDVLQKMTSRNYITVSESPKFDKGDIVMISDCHKADIFIIDDVYTKDDTQVIYTNSNLSVYKEGAIVSHWMQPILYVANTDRVDDLGRAIPALYWHQLNGSDDELVEGVSQFKVIQKDNKITVHLTSVSLDKIDAQTQQWQFNAYV